MDAALNNNPSQIASLATLLSDGDYEIADAFREMINILKKSLEDKYLEIENRDYILPSSISDESIVWTIDELDSTINTLINTNTQPKMLLYKTLGNIYMWLHNYNKNL